MKNINVPPGYVVLEVKIPRSGPVKTKIVRDGTGICAANDDKRLIDGVLNGPLAGFGERLGPTVEQGRTNDYWKQVQPKLPQLPQENDTEDDPYLGPKSKEKKLDQGYGV